jgi:hypothetical protein
VDEWVSQFGKTVRPERTPAALRLQGGARDGASDKELTNCDYGLAGEVTELRREGNLTAAPGLRMEQGASRHVTLEHLLQTESLGTELDIIVVPHTPPSALILDRKWHVVAELHNIGGTADFQIDREYGESTNDTDARGAFVPGRIGSFVPHGSFDGESVFAKKTLHVNQSAPPIAVQEVIERREENGFRHMRRRAHVTGYRQGGPLR